MTGPGVAGSATQEQRTAGVAVLVVGGLNLALGLMLTLSAMNADARQAALVYGVLTVVGLLFVVFGIRIRRGSRGATIAALVLLGVAALADVVVLLTGEIQAVVRLLVTAVVLWLLARAYRSV